MKSASLLVNDLHIAFIITCPITITLIMLFVVIHLLIRSHQQVAEAIRRKQEIDDIDDCISRKVTSNCFQNKSTPYEQKLVDLTTKTSSNSTNKALVYNKKTLIWNLNMGKTKKVKTLKKKQNGKLKNKGINAHDNIYYIHDEHNHDELKSKHSPSVSYIDEDNVEGGIRNIIRSRRPRERSI